MHLLHIFDRFHFNTKEVIIISVSSVILLSEVIYHWYKARQKSRSCNGYLRQPCKNEENKPRIFDVMFFSSDSAQCRLHRRRTYICKKSNCAVNHLRRITDYLNSATNTLDVCIYFFTCQELALAVVNAQKRGVVVRIIIDETMAQNEKSKTLYFYKEGLKPKVKRLNFLIHHKFAIIDNDIVITGSVNWTASAFFGNFENIIVTNEIAIVKPFINEFESIWTMLNSIETNPETREYIII